MDSQIRNLDRLHVAATVWRRGNVGRWRHSSRAVVRIPDLVDNGRGGHVTAVVGQGAAEDLHRVVGRRRRCWRLLVLLAVVVSVRRSVHVDRRTLVVAVVDDVIVVPAHTDLKSEHHLFLTTLFSSSGPP